MNQPSDKNKSEKIIDENKNSVNQNDKIKNTTSNNTIIKNKS
jgi:hypothetical protein